MNVDDTLFSAVRGLELVLVLSAPVLVTSLVVGLVVAIAQTLTQVQEQTLSFVPKLVAVSLVLLAVGPWMGAEIVRYTSEAWASIAAMSR